MALQRLSSKLVKHGSLVLNTVLDAIQANVNSLLQKTSNMENIDGGITLTNKDGAYPVPVITAQCRVAVVSPGDAATQHTLFGIESITRQGVGVLLFRFKEPYRLKSDRVLLCIDGGDAYIPSVAGFGEPVAGQTEAFMTMQVVNRATWTNTAADGGVINLQVIRNPAML